MKVSQKVIQATVIGTQDMEEIEMNVEVICFNGVEESITETPVILEVIIVVIVVEEEMGWIQAVNTMGSDNLHRDVIVVQEMVHHIENLIEVTWVRAIITENLTRIRVANS